MDVDIGHEESYNPPVEYIPTEEEIKSYEAMYEEDRPKFIPKMCVLFTSSILRVHLYVPFVVSVDKCNLS